MIKKISIVLVLVLLFMLQLSPIASAAEFDPDRDGSLVITMEYQGDAIAGMELTIFKVADIELVASKYTWVIADEFADTNVSFDQLDTDANIALAKVLYDYAVEHNISGITKTTDGNGKADFGGNLEAGLYLVVQTAEHDDYYDLEPFLVSLPTETNDEMNYALDITPKTEIAARENDRPTPPIDPKHPIIPKDGGYEEIDENGVPLGDWTYDEDQGIWIFDERPPLAELPQTGVLRWPIPVMAIAGLLLFCAGWVINRKERNTKDRANEG